MVAVALAGNLRAAVGGAAEVTVEATTIRELLGKLGERYPRLAEQIDNGIAVSVNGDIWRDARDVPIPEGAEVFLLPRIAGG